MNAPAASEVRPGAGTVPAWRSCVLSAIRARAGCWSRRLPSWRSCSCCRWSRLVIVSFTDAPTPLATTERFLDQAVYLRSLGNTIQIALVVPAVSPILGYPTALAMASSGQAASDPDRRSDRTSVLHRRSGQDLRRDGDPGHPRPHQRAAHGVGSDRRANPPAVHARAVICRAVDGAAADHGAADHSVMTRETRPCPGQRRRWAQARPRRSGASISGRRFPARWPACCSCS